jgi:hypothetical protein
MQRKGGFFNNVAGCFLNMAFMLIFLVVGVGLCWWGWTILQDARASATWPSVEGQITNTNLDYSRDADSGDSYSPEVSYTYWMPLIMGVQFFSGRSI